MIHLKTPGTIYDTMKYCFKMLLCKQNATLLHCMLQNMQYQT